MMKNDSAEAPRAAEADMHLVPLTVRFTGDAYNAIRDTAAENGISAAELIRLAVDDRLSEYLGTIRFVDLEQGEEIRAAVRDLYDAVSGLEYQMRKIGINFNQSIRFQRGIINKWHEIPTDKLTLGQRMQIQSDEGLAMHRMSLDESALDRAVKLYYNATGRVVNAVCRIQQ